MTILYVEDDPDDRELFREAISHINPAAKVVLASDADEAIDLLEQGPAPAMIFIDYNLEGLTRGKDLLSEMRKEASSTRCLFSCTPLPRAFNTNTIASQ